MPSQRQPTAAFHTVYFDIPAARVAHSCRYTGRNERSRITYKTVPDPTSSRIGSCRSPCRPVFRPAIYITKPLNKLKKNLIIKYNKSMHDFVVEILGKLLSTDHHFVLELFECRQFLNLIIIFSNFECVNSPQSYHKEAIRHL